MWRNLPIVSCLALLLGGSAAALAQSPGLAPPLAPESATGTAVAFYILAAAAAASAIGCVIATNIVRMAMCLLGTLGCVALLYFLMAANFLGVIQLIVYAGGTLIVIVFGIMLTTRTYGVRLRPKRIEVVAGLLVGVALFVGLTAILLRTSWMTAAPEPAGYTVAGLGQALLSTYLVPFELVSVLLLAVMIGAAYLSQPETSRKVAKHES
jgi:NADH:ubiquinone oxidoreductase subunit 6 (subunit J)